MYEEKWYWQESIFQKKKKSSKTTVRIDCFLLYRRSNDLVIVKTRGKYLDNC